MVWLRGWRGNRQHRRGARVVLRERVAGCQVKHDDEGAPQSPSGVAAWPGRTDFPGERKGEEDEQHVAVELVVAEMVVDDALVGIEVVAKGGEIECGRRDSGDVVELVE